MTLRTFLAFPEDFARESFNTSRVLDLPGISGDMWTLWESPGDIKDVGVGMYIILRGKHSVNIDISIAT